MNGAGTELVDELALVPCPVVAACGGCPLMPSVRQRELEAKQASVSRALARAELLYPALEWACVLDLFDMFPNTRHVEVLAWLERR